MTPATLQPTGRTCGEPGMWQQPGLCCQSRPPGPSPRVVLGTTESNGTRGRQTRTCAEAVFQPVQFSDLHDTVCKNTNATPQLL